MRATNNNFYLPATTRPTELTHDHKLATRRLYVGGADRAKPVDSGTAAVEKGDGYM